MRIILTGPKGAGKTAKGRKLAASLGLPFSDTDELIEDEYGKTHTDRLNIKEIYAREGKEFFARIEREAADLLAGLDFAVISVGGGAFLNPAVRQVLRPRSVVVFIDAPDAALWSRVQQKGVPAFLAGSANPESDFYDRAALIREAVIPFCDFVHAEQAGLDLDQEVASLRENLSACLTTLMYSPSTFGHLVRVTTFGESHGKAIGAILDGVPPGLPLDEQAIQDEMRRRRPGQSAITTQRSETDNVKVLSGVFEGKTTGAPIALMVENKDQFPGAYDALRNVFRPGHADFSFLAKFGIRDHRGGGRSSGRETSARVASGAVAKQILAGRGVKIVGFARRIADIEIGDPDLSVIESNPVRAADAKAAVAMQQRIETARNEGDSVGGIAEIRITGVPAGLGDPVFYKLDARLAMAMVSLGAVKGIEIGAGFRAASMRGSQCNDQRDARGFLSNNAGGILGGISTGQEIVLRVAIKPTASISSEQSTIDVDGNEVKLSVEGRHDPCIVPRIIPVLESMAALTILDAWEIQARLNPEWPRKTW